MSNQRVIYDVEVYRGDTPRFTYKAVEVYPDTGEEVPVDITLHTITGQVRKTTDSDVVWYEFPIVKSDAKQGRFYWQITKEDSETLLPSGSLDSESAVYDIQMEINNNVHTFVSGSFKITRDITRR